MRNELRLEFIAARRLQERGDVPVFFGDETLDFRLAVTDETERHGLYAAGRARTRQLAPENRRKVEADEIVKRAAGEIGVHQRRVDVARIGHGIEHGLLGDGVEDDALDRLVADHFLLLQKVEHMPRNRFPLAIRVGCEKQAVG